MASVAREMSHFYNKEGNLVTEVPNKSKGGMRPCSLADAKKLGLVPGPTSVLSSCSSKEWLLDWKLNLLDAHLKEKGYDKTRHLKHIAEELSSTGRNFGTLIHKWMERLWKGEVLLGVNESIISKIHREFREGFVQEVIEIEVGFYDSVMNIGGTRDLIVNSKAGKMTVVDYKSTSDMNKKLPDDYIHQLHFYSGGGAMDMMILWLGTDGGERLTGEWKTEVIPFSEERWEYCQLARRMFKLKNGI